MNVYGRNNRIGDLRCIGIDANLAKQLNEIADVTKHNQRLLSSIVAQMQAIVQQVTNGSSPSTSKYVGRPGNPNIVGNGTIPGNALNRDTHQAPVFTALQQADLAKELKPYNGQRVIMQVQTPTQDADAFATALADSMKSAGLSVLVYRGMQVDPIIPPGISASAGEKAKPVFITIHAFLKKNDLIKGPIPFSDSTPPGVLWITIAPW